MQNTDSQEQPLVSIDRLSWRLSPGTERALHARVRKAALHDAIEKAKNYASVLGGSVRVTEISDNSGGGAAGGARMFAAAGTMRSGQKPTITIEPEPITVNAHIFVKFEMF